MKEAENKQNQQRLTEGRPEEIQGVLTKLRVLYGCLAVVLFIVLLMVLALYPFNHKIVGRWENPSGYQLEIKKKQCQLKVSNLQNVQGTDLVIETILKPKGTNRYQGDNPEFFLEIDTAKLSANELEELREQSQTDFTEASSNNGGLRLKFTKAALKKLYPDRIDELITLRIDKLSYLAKGTELMLRNDYFAKEGLLFYRIE